MPSRGWSSVIDLSHLGLVARLLPVRFPPLPVTICYTKGTASHHLLSILIFVPMGLIHVLRSHVSLGFYKIPVTLPDADPIDLESQSELQHVFHFPSGNQRRQLDAHQASCGGVA